MVCFGEDRGQRQCRRRERDFVAVSQKIIQRRIAKGLFHHTQVGDVIHVSEVIRGVGGLFEMQGGRRKVARCHGQAAEFQVGHGGQRMFEFA